MRLERIQQLMSVSLGVAYLWFGMLKFFAGASPAEALVQQTVHAVSLGLLPDAASIYIVATWEVILGLLLLSGLKRNWAAIGVLAHMPFTFLPLVLLPELCFQTFPVFTLIGQYIIKNLVLVSGALLLLVKASPAPR